MERLKAIVLKLLRSAAECVPRSRRKRRVLLDTGSAMAATYLEDLRRLFATDDRLEFHQLIRPQMPAEERARCLALLHCPAIACRVAKFFPWDLVVLADHPVGELDVAARYGVLRISHGVGGKQVAGHDYMYGPRLYGRDGRLRYSCIFESSESRRASAIAAHPELRDVVRLVGHLQLDKLRQASARAAARGSESARPTVLIAGSWSAGNLYERMGRDLTDAAARLLGDYAFVLRPHPHMFKDPGPANWSAFFAEQKTRGFVISPPTEELGWVLAAASVIICDDLSSVALYAAALGKRIVIVPTGSSQVPPGSFGERLARLAPGLATAAELEAVLASALRQAPPAGIETLAAEINSRPGQAARLVRDELYRLVDLPPFASGVVRRAFISRQPKPARTPMSRSA